MSEREAVTDRVWTIPNVLSMLRLVGVPVFLWLILTERDNWAIALLMVSGFTDYLDGKIARRFGLISRIGQLLDPLADRLYVLSTLFGFGWRDIIPWWFAGLLVARELFVASLGPVLQRHRLPIPPVHFVGKAATLCLIYAFPLILLGNGASPVAGVALPIGWAFAWWGTALYWVAGIAYAGQIRAMVRASKASNGGSSGKSGSTGTAAGAAT